MIRNILDLISPAGNSGRLSIFIFHRVLPGIDPLFPDEPDAERFDQMMNWIKSWLNVLPLDQAVARLSDGTLPARAAAITFDDGYADNRVVALPILQKYNLTATFFVATGFLDGGRMWNDTIIEAIRFAPSEELNLNKIGLGCHKNQSAQDKRLAINAIIDKVKYMAFEERNAITENIASELGVTPPSDLMMTSAQVCELYDAGMQIGAHTVSHPILARTAPKVAEYEIGESKATLEKLLGEPISLFAYPNGKLGHDYIPEHCEIVRKLGFLAAVSTNWGASHQSTDFFQMPRFTPWDRSKAKFGTRLIRNYFF